MSTTELAVRIDRLKTSSRQAQDKLRNVNLDKNCIALPYDIACELSKLATSEHSISNTGYK